jgi:hypothetical protein
MTPIGRPNTITRRAALSGSGEKRPRVIVPSQMLDRAEKEHQCAGAKARGMPVSTINIQKRPDSAALLRGNTLDCGGYAMLSTTPLPAAGSPTAPAVHPP